MTATCIAASGLGVDTDQSLPAASRAPDRYWSPNGYCQVLPGLEARIINDYCCETCGSLQGENVTYAFIRHGQTDFNRDGLLQGSSDIPLNELGRSQAVDAAAILASTDWAAVVSSGLMRARETAQIIAARLAIDLGPAYPELAERDYGALEGTSAAEALIRWPSREYPGAESVASVVARGRAGLARVVADFPDQDVVIVGHGTIIRYTLAALAGHALDGIVNGSISTFRLDGDRWEVLTVNGTPLDPAADAADAN